MTERPGQDEPPLSRMRERVVVVTGGAGAIGSAISARLDQLGTRVVVAGRNSDKVGQTVDALRHAVAYADCDLRESGRAEALIGFTIDRFGTLDAVVNCVGIGRASHAGPITADAVAAIDERAWDEVIDTNLRGIFYLCRAATPAMIAKGGGQILDVSSARGARRGQAFGAAYCASKRACLAMLQSLDKELRGRGVRVVSVLPDAVETALIAGTGLAHRGAMRPESLAEHIVGVLAARSEVTCPEIVVLPNPSEVSH